MSEDKQVYQIMPVGEIYYPEDDQEPEEVTIEIIDAQEFFITTLENILKELNVAIKEIEPLVNDCLEMRNSKHGPKLVKPAMTPLYKLATSIHIILQSRG